MTIIDGVGLVSVTFFGGFVFACFYFLTFLKDLLHYIVIVVDRPALLYFVFF